MKITRPQALKSINRGIRTNQPRPPEPSLCAYIARDSVSREYLILLANVILNIPLSFQQIPCSDCLEDIALFVECEHKEGILKAIHTYPNLWFHLWTCNECAATYHMTYDMVVAEQHGEMPTLSLYGQESIPLKKRMIEIVTLTRDLLTQAFATVTQPQFVAAGSDDSDIVIVDEHTDNGSVTVSVQPDGARPWHITVNVIPPPVGRAVVQCRDLYVTATFDQYGEAVFPTIPADVLTSLDGPDVVVGIEVD